jgi:hypothetical protein
VWFFERAVGEIFERRAGAVPPPKAKLQLEDAPARRLEASFPPRFPASGRLELTLSSRRRQRQWTRAIAKQARLCVQYRNAINPCIQASLEPSNSQKDRMLKRRAFERWVYNL